MWIIIVLNHMVNSFYFISIKVNVWSSSGKGIYEKG